MKICVYTISLNEINNIEAFMESCKPADLVLVCDTGSTDGTQEKLRELGAIVYNIRQTPWRFDIARNTALSLIPEDIDVCISLDLDERLYKGWRSELEKAWTTHTTRLSYDYIWDWTIDGKPGTRFFTDKIHSRHNYIWRHPCHETLYYVGSETEHITKTPNLTILHESDPNKDRSQYLSLLELAVKEDTINDRMRFYYARELMYHKKYVESINEFEIYLTLPDATWKEERAAAYRNLAHCYKMLNQITESKNTAMKAILETPHARESWLTMARLALAIQDWNTCFWAATSCLAINIRSYSYLSDSECWGSLPYDLAAISAYQLGLYGKAVEYGRAAVELNPTDERLQANLNEYILRSTNG